MKKYKQEVCSPWCASFSGSPAEPCNCPASELVKRFKCETCDREYGTRWALKIHLAMENKRPRFHLENKGVKDMGKKTLREEIRNEVTGICWNPHCEGDANCLVDRNKALDQIMKFFSQFADEVIGEDEEVECELGCCDDDVRHTRNDLKKEQRARKEELLGKVITRK